MLMAALNNKQLGINVKNQEIDFKHRLHKSSEVPAPKEKDQLVWKRTKKHTRD